MTGPKDVVFLLDVDQRIDGLLQLVLIVLHAFLHLVTRCAPGVDRYADVSLLVGKAGPSRR